MSASTDADHSPLDVGKAPFRDDRMPAVGAFSASPRAFIQAYAEQLGLTEAELSAVAVDYLVARMESGTTRFETLHALRRLKGIDAGPYSQGTVLAASRFSEAGRAVIFEQVLDFATGNTKAFVRHAFRQVLGRGPSDPQLLRITHEIDTGITERAQLLTRLARMAEQEGIELSWDTHRPVETGTDGTTASFVSLSGQTLDEKGRMTLSICARTETGWSIDDRAEVTIQGTRDGFWSIHPGFVLRSARPHLQPGRWRLDLNIALEDDQEMMVDIIANSGLQELFSVRFAGSIAGSFVFDKASAHTFPQVRLKALGTAPTSVAVQHIRLVRLGDR